MADDAGAAMQGLNFGNGGGGNPGNAGSATGNNGAGAGDGGPGPGNNGTGGTGDGQPAGNAAGTGIGNGGDSNGGGDGGGNGPAPDPESEDARIVRLTRELEEAFAARANKAGGSSDLGSMFMSKDDAANARAAIAKPTAPPPCPIQPGFQADPQATAISETARKTIRRLGYCPLTSLDSEARTRASRGGGPAMDLQPDGSFKERDLDRSRERFIDERRFNSAADTYVRVLKEEVLHTGAGTDEAFKSHFTICKGLFDSHFFHVVMAYDQRNREIHAADHRHDISTLNMRLLAIVSTAAPPGGSAPATPSKRHADSAPSSSHAPPRKVARSSAQHTSETKGQRCFRCGEYSGHMPVGCPAELTTAGRTAFELAKGSRSQNALISPSGRTVCFNWASSGYCRTVPPPAPLSDPRGVVTPLDANAIETLLGKLGLLGEWQHVIDSLRSGFDAGVDTKVDRTFIPKNHSSIQLDPTFIDTYIAAEVAANRFVGPFEPDTLERIIGPFRTNPLGLVPKPGTDKHRMVNDLSFPRDGDPVPAVNLAIDRSQFITEWGDFTKMAQAVLDAPPGTMAATFDISAAYRITPIRPDQQHVLCVTWRGKVYIDRAACFGMASSSGIFGAIADMLVAIYKASGYRVVLKWVDDFVVFRLPGDSFSEEDFVHLTSALGVPWSVAKTRSFAYRQKYIGFIWDLVRKTVAMPEEKLSALRSLLDAWLEPKAKFNAGEAESLHGKVVHAATIFPLVRPFLPSISHFPRGFKNGYTKHSLPGPVQKDITWIRDILEHAPNEISLTREEPLDIGWWGDASSSWGIGVVVGSFWAAWHWADGFTVGPKCNRDIGWAEAVAVELGLRMAVHHGIIGARPTNRSRILVRSDNAGVVAVVNKGRSKSAHTNGVLKDIYRTLVSEGIVLSADRIPDRDDALALIAATSSRWLSRPLVMKASAWRIDPPSEPGQPGSLVSVTLSLKPSRFRPDVSSDDRIYKWCGPNTPPLSVLPTRLFQYLQMRAIHEVLAEKTTSGYGSGLRKFHVFCDIYSIPDEARLPASFELLNSFAHWASTEPDPSDPELSRGDCFEPVSTGTVKTYLSAISTWHVIQGWPAPLSKVNYERIKTSLRGLGKLQKEPRSRPPRPPVTLPMLAAIKRSLDLSSPYDACLWAIATCAFWGMMRFGEATVDARKDYNPKKKLARKHVFFGHDLDGKPYARLDLPTAKTAKQGEIQKIFLTAQGEYCPLAALQNLARVVPAEADDPLFSWVDSTGSIRPMTRSAALSSLNEITQRHGWGTAFGHSFRIGGASFYLAQGVSPEIVRLAGRWKSLAYETYIRAFEQVASRHLSGLGAGQQPFVRPASALVGGAAR
ncbi:unnamed protein product [Peniophora sp. CBMAI 1063]|nr:unnamed protein product [Peniophora sp. CBMAI 1063]